MTKEGKIIIGVICFLILIAIIVPGDDSSADNSPAKLTPTASAVVLKNKEAANKSAQQEPKKNLEIKGLKIASEDIKIKNPFTYGHESRGEKIIKNDIKGIKSEPKNSDTKIKKQDANLTKNDKTKAKWKLTGIIIIGEDKTAILSRENESKTLSAGDSFDDKKIVEIGENYIVYADGNGQGRLNLSLN